MAQDLSHGPASRAPAYIVEEAERCFGTMDAHRRIAGTIVSRLATFDPPVEVAANFYNAEFVRRCFEEVRDVLLTSSARNDPKRSEELRELLGTVEKKLWEEAIKLATSFLDENRALDKSRYSAIQARRLVFVAVKRSLSPNLMAADLMGPDLAGTDSTVKHSRLTFSLSFLANFRIRRPRS